MQHASIAEDVVIELANRDGAARTVSSDGAKDSQNNVKLVVDLGDKRATEIPLTGKLVVDLQQNSGAASTVNSDGAKDSQNNVKLVVDMSDKGTLEIPLTGKLVADNNDFEFFMEMRGWILTVATLFVAMSFQGAMQPPAWMPKGDWIRVLPKHYGTTTGATFSSSHADRPAMPTPPLSPPPAITVDQAIWADCYVTFNALTFAMALALVVLLVMTANSRAAPRLTAVTLYGVKGLVVGIACCVSVTFVLGTSDQPHIITFVSIIITAMAVGTFIIIIINYCLAAIYFRRKKKRAEVF